MNLGQIQPLRALVLTQTRGDQGAQRRIRSAPTVDPDFALSTAALVSSQSCAFRQPFVVGKFNATIKAPDIFELAVSGQPGKRSESDGADVAFSGLRRYLPDLPSSVRCLADILRILSARVA
jgi:hypothetical protein